MVLKRGLYSPVVFNGPSPESALHSPVRQAGAEAARASAVRPGPSYKNTTPARSCPGRVYAAPSRLPGLTSSQPGLRPQDWGYSTPPPEAQRKLTFYSPAAAPPGESALPLRSPPPLTA